MKCKYCGANDWWFDHSNEGEEIVGDRCNKCGRARNEEPSELRDRISDILQIANIPIVSYKTALQSILALIEPLQAENESLKKSLAEAVEVIKPFANWNYPEEVWMPHDLISIILQAKRFLGKRG